MEANVKAVELRDLWRRYKTDGDERARERLVVAYSPLVKYVAGRMGSGLPSHVAKIQARRLGLFHRHVPMGGKKGGGRRKGKTAGGS